MSMSEVFMDVLVRCWKNVEAEKPDIQFTIYEAPSEEAALSMVKRQYPPVFQYFEAREIVDVEVEKND